MMVSLTARRIGGWLMLIAAWCALWGSFSIANVASGAVASALVLGAGIGPPTRGRVRMVPLLRLTGLVLWDLVRSTASVARSIVGSDRRVEEAIVEVALPASARRHLLLLICAVTVTPGTAVVDADPDTGTLYLHLLHYDERESVEAHVAELCRLADQALPARAGVKDSSSPARQGVL